MLFNPFELIERAIEHLFSLLEGTKSNKKLSASFGSPRNILKKQNTGFNFGGRKNITRDASYRGALVIGASGSGKSRKCLIPSILTMQGSLVIHDPSGELYRDTRKELKVRGYDIRVFNASDLSVSESFNFLEEVTTTGEASRKARSIVEASYGQNLSFWETSALELISLCISYLALKPDKTVTLPNVWSLIRACSSDLHQVVKAFKDLGDAELLKRCLAFAHQEEKMRSGVLATALSSLFFLADEKVVHVTSSNTLDLGSIRKRKTALFIQSKTTDANYHSVLNSLLFERLFEIILDHLPLPHEEDVFFLIDEAGGLLIPSLPTIASPNVRKYRSGILLCVQDYQMLVAQYGKERAQTIRSNCYSTFIFGGVGLEEGQHLERLCGSYEYVNELGQTRIRPLITASEVRTLDKKYALLIYGTDAPMKVKLSNPKRSFISRFVSDHAF